MLLFLHQEPRKDAIIQTRAQPVFSVSVNILDFVCHARSLWHRHWKNTRGGWWLRSPGPFALWPSSLLIVKPCFSLKRLYKRSLLSDHIQHSEGLVPDDEWVL